MTKQKVDFLRNDFVEKLSQIPADKKGIFGKMNLHQMIEHMTWAFKLASGKIYIENKNTPEMVEKMHRFMMSDKPFKENTPNSFLPDEPYPVQTASVRDAITELSKEIDYFISVYANDEELRIENPFFGMLSFDEQVHLLHKHSLHHLRQFEAA